MNLVLGAKERWLNVGLFILFMLGSVDAVKSAYEAGHFGWVDISFAVQNVVFCAVVVLRKPANAVDGSFTRQAVALVAFFFGLLFFGEPLTGNGALRLTGQIVVVCANILAVICMVALGKLFGILIACRELRVTGRYSFARTPCTARILFCALAMRRRILRIKQPLCL